MAIHGYDGVPGAGKSSAAVNRLWSSARPSVFPVRRPGQVPYSNVPLIDLRMEHDEKGNSTGLALNPATFGFPWSSFVETVDDLLSVRSGLILLDEVDMWFSAVEWGKIGFDARRFWTQHRKNGLNIIWTCTHIDRMLNVIRDITELVFRCSKLPFMPRWSVQKIFNPQETSTSKKSSMLTMLKLHEHLWELYHSNFIVGNGVRLEVDNRGFAIESKDKKPVKVVAAEFGAADLGANIEIRIGDYDDIMHLASLGTMYRPAGPGELQQVAPLIRPGVARRLALYVARILQEGDRSTPQDRATACRLLSILHQLSGGQEFAWGGSGNKQVMTSQSKIIQLTNKQIDALGVYDMPIRAEPRPKEL